MNKDLHDMDELFRSALEDYKETPSAGVKESLIAALDKKDVGSYKKRFIIWKRASLLLLLLLAGFVVYESGILKKSSGISDKKTAAEKINSTSEEKQELINPNNTLSDNANNNTDYYKKEALNNNIDNTANDVSKSNEIINQPGQRGIFTPPVSEANSDAPSLKENLSKNKIRAQQNNFLTEQAGSRTVNAKLKTRVTQSNSGNSNLLNNAERLPTERINSFQSPNKTGFKQIIAQVNNNLKNWLSPITKDSVFKNPIAKNKILKSFTPFWMITGFTSYDQWGYKLDSDEPSAIKSIKFREAHEPSFSIGLLLSRQFTRRWSLQSGAIYSNSAIGMKPQKTYAFQDPTGNISYKYITSSGYAYIKPGFGAALSVGDSLTTAEAKHRIDILSIPLVVKFTALNKRISIVPGVGIEANFITKANLEVDIEDPFNREIVVVRKLNGTKTLYRSFVADVELRYNINKKTAVTLRPVYRYAVSPITKNNVVETFPHSFGIGAGLTIKF
jgi:hypothetical protein